ncbi:uncharacterized protein BN676_01805 [Brachyspira sp. CAG:484]|nr:uncharacterized protein BN676_01805 [Brachyspira sp. CAG:484]
MKFRNLFYFEKVKASNHMIFNFLGVKMKFKIRYGGKMLEDEVELLKKRLLKIDKIANIGSILFFVPQYDKDLIQRYIVERNKFFEQNILLELLEYIPKHDAVILDIGANIGNHTLYWAALCDAKTVYSFEPVKSTFDILSKNISLNNLENKVKLFNIGLSDEICYADVSAYYETNIGGISVKKSSLGKLKLDMLDNIKIEEDRVDFIKIDVEGHELCVLNGAMNTLKKYSPKIFVETGNLNAVTELLKPLGYKIKKEFENNNYLFIK